MLALPIFKASDGKEIYYEVQGEGKRSVAFLNGIMMTTSSWGVLANYIASAGFRVILHDMRGQGRSGRIREMLSIERHSKDLAELLDYIGIERVNIIATSYGGKVALHFSLSYPSRVESMALLNTCHTSDKFIRAGLDAWMIPVRMRSGKFLYKSILPQLYSISFLNKNWDSLNKLSVLFEQLDFDSLEEMIKAFYDCDLRGKLASIRAPVLIVAGNEDRVFPPYYSKLIASEIPGSKYVEIETGHVSVWERPEEIGRILISFLKGG